MQQFDKTVKLDVRVKRVPFGTKCSLCGRKLSFFETGYWSVLAKNLTDGVLCKDCDNKLDTLLTYPAAWLTKAQQQESPYCDYKPFQKRTMDVQTAAQFISLAETSAKEMLAEAGASYTSLFRMADARIIYPSAGQVGSRRKKLLEGKLVLFGFVQQGQFKKDDPVVILDGKNQKTATVLEAYEYDDEKHTLDVMLRTRVGDQRLKQWQTGWLILDSEDNISRNTSVIG